MENIFNEDVPQGGLPDPNDPATFEMAKLRWEDFEQPEAQAALERTRYLAKMRREVVWPLAATFCRDARSTRQGTALLIEWEFHAGTLAMALNPGDMPTDISCLICGDPVTTGEFSQHGEVLRLGPWSAVAWRK